MPSVSGTRVGNNDIAFQTTWPVGEKFVEAVKAQDPRHWRHLIVVASVEIGGEQIGAKAGTLRSLVPVQIGDEKDVVIPPP